MSAPEPPASLAALADALRSFTFALPGAYEDHPWGESVAKVNKKVFVFFGALDALDRQLQLGVKLPESAGDVLALPIAEPAGYGLGRSGWVTIRMLPDDRLPLGLLQGWVLESYRAVAPKRLVAQLPAGPRPG